MTRSSGERSGAVVSWTPGREGAGSEERTGEETAQRLPHSSANTCHAPEADIDRNTPFENDEHHVLGYGSTRVGDEKIMPFLPGRRLVERSGTALWCTSFPLPAT